MSGEKIPLQQSPTISPDQIADAAAAGVEMLQLDTTLVPGNLRKRIGLLELILQQVARGHATLANPDQKPVESKPEAQPKTQPLWKRAATRKE